MAESLIKQLTGGEKIAARFLNKEWFEFYPTFKVILSTNHNPKIKGTDNAIWRRIRLVPWTVTIPEPEQDRDLAEKLKAELPGILNWAIEGCLDWQREGLKPPDQVLEATNSYRAEMDTIADFIEECTERRESAKTPKSEVYKGYSDWCERSGEKPITTKAFTELIEEKGFESGRSGRFRYWRDMILLADE